VTALQLAFVVAVIALTALPGPNVALIVASSLSHGVRCGLLSVAGICLGLALQLGLVVAGLTAAVAVVADVMAWLRWIGVAYLLALGIWTWTRAAPDLAVPKVAGFRPVRVVWQGAALSLVNPKTLLFYVAFLPQFVAPGADPTRELLVLACLALAVSAIGDCGWAALAAAVRPVLVRIGRWRNRITGALLVGAGAALATARA